MSMMENAKGSATMEVAVQTLLLNMAIAGTI